MYYTARVPRVKDPICVVTLYATVTASGSLTYLVGCGVTSDDSYKVCKWQWLVEYRIKMNT